MRSWIKTTLIVAVGASAVLGGLAFARGPAGACGWHGGGHWGTRMSEADAARWRERVIDRVSGELKLDEAQRGRLVALAEVMRQQRQALAPAGAAPHEALAGLVAGERFDAAGAEGLLREKMQAVQAGGPAVIAAAAAFFDGLRPEQQQQVRDVLARGRPGPGGWGG